MRTWIEDESDEKEEDGEADDDVSSDMAIATTFLTQNGLKFPQNEGGNIQRSNIKPVGRIENSKMKAVIERRRDAGALTVGEEKKKARGWVKHASL